MPSIGLSRALGYPLSSYPEMKIVTWTPARRRLKAMDKQGNISIFLSRGAPTSACRSSRIERRQWRVQRDPFGLRHPADTTNPGQWFAGVHGEKIDAEIIVSATSRVLLCANADDSSLIVDDRPGRQSVSAWAVRYIGHDEEDNDRLKAIAFPRIVGGKPFDISAPWFTRDDGEIGQSVELAGSEYSFDAPDRGRRPCSKPAPSRASPL